MPNDELSSAEMYGTAKKINNDLEQLPLHTHGAMIQLLNIAFEHRKLAMAREEKLRQDALQERQMKFQEEMMQRQREAAQRADAEALVKAAQPTQVPQ